MKSRRLRTPYANVLRRPPQRDNEASAFAEILERLARRLPGVLALVLVDSEGETVDYWTRLDPWDTRVAGAQVQLFFRLVGEGLQDPLLWSTFRLGGGEAGAIRSFTARKVGPIYTMVAEFDPAVLRLDAGRSLAIADRELALEGGWAPPPVPWNCVTVHTDRFGRPRRIADSAHTLYGRPTASMFPEPADSGDDFDILGKIQGLPLRERGWRIRLKGGHELNLVREPGDFWFVDGVV